MSKRPALLTLLASTTLAAGCGSGGDATKGAAAKPPTVVTAEDLDKSGDLWVQLTPDLKDELVDSAKDRLGEERPGGATEIRALDSDELIGEIDKQYTNASKRSTDIYTTYVFANDSIARETLDKLMPALERGE